MQSSLTRLAMRPRGVTGSLSSGPGAATTPSLATSIFYSDFEDATDRSQWGTPPAGWNDAYDTVKLFGNYSLYAAGYYAGKEHFTDAGLFPDDTTGTVYARMAFRKLVGSVGSSGLGLQFRLLNDSTLVAGAGLYWDDGLYFYRIYAYSSSSDNYASTDAVAFDGDTYWFYLTYNRTAGTVLAEVKDSSHVLVTSFTVTRTGAASLAVDQISIRLNVGTSLKVVVDNVEVRKDTSWGT